MADPRLTTQTLAVLAVLLAAPAFEAYGLQIADDAGLTTGTVYPILKRLLEAGWLESRPEDIDPRAEGRPRRRLYQLTGAGQQAARTALDEQLRLLARAAKPAPSWRPLPGSASA